MAHPNPHFPWDILPDEVISSSSKLTPSVQLLRAIANKSTLENRIVDIADKHYQIAYTPLKDAAGGNSGTLHVLIDVSKQITRQRHLSLILITAAAGIGGLLTLLFYMIVMRLETELQHNYQTLKKEIEERRTAQNETDKLKEELEQRIESRTAQLQRLNQQLIQDNDERRKTELALSASEERYRTLFDASGIAMALLDRDSIVECNDAFVHLFSYQSHQDLLHRDPAILSPSVQPNGEKSVPLALNEIKKAVKRRSHKFEWLFKRADNSTFPAEISLTIVKYGDRHFVHAIVQDITERKKAESKVIQHAYFDTLTGLPNRNLFMDRLEQALEHNKRAAIQGSVLFTDLDHFKNVNDSLGHEKGDLLLKEVAKRLRQAIRKEDTVARFGGDEFVILLPDIHENYDKAVRTTQRIADKIRKSFERPFKVKPYEFHLTPSIGATLFPAESDNLEDILKHADAAMYQAKASGRNTVRFFEQKMQQSLEQRLLMEKDLRLALKRQEFSLVFQPQVDHQQRIIGAEALVRWTHPKQGPVSPADFIPIAEETGLIIQLGQRILEESLNFLHRLNQLKLTTDDFHLSINISPLQFRQPDMVSDFSDALLARQIPANSLTLEITEGILMDDIADSSTKLEQLKELGFCISIDDFGTGYSSLAYLKKLNIDELKVDQSFIRDISSDPNDAAIVEAIIPCHTTWITGCSRRGGRKSTTDLPYAPTL
jgi:diguanylate cyclase (GGDEF)-like protein/PAS domain S-box-containing protein